MAVAPHMLSRGCLFLCVIIQVCIVCGLFLASKALCHIRLGLLDHRLAASCAAFRFEIAKERRDWRHDHNPRFCSLRLLYYNSTCFIKLCYKTLCCIITDLLALASVCSCFLCISTFLTIPYCITTIVCTIISGIPGLDQQIKQIRIMGNFHIADAVLFHPIDQGLVILLRLQFDPDQCRAVVLVVLFVYSNRVISSCGPSTPSMNSRKAPARCGKLMMK